MSRVSQNKLVCSMTEAIKVGLWLCQSPNISEVSAKKKCRIKSGMIIVQTLFQKIYGVFSLGGASEEVEVSCLFRDVSRAWCLENPQRLLGVEWYVEGFGPNAVGSLAVCRRIAHIP